MKKQDIAVNQFMEGYRCSQAVLSAFAPELNMDMDLARKISLGLAGGSSVGGECGAVGAAYLAIALKFGFAHPGDPEKLRLVMGKIKTFVERFESLHGGINCPDLIGLDIFSEEGHQEFLRNNIKATKCAKFVSDAVGILDDLLSA